MYETWAGLVWGQRERVLTGDWRVNKEERSTNQPCIIPIIIYLIQCCEYWKKFNPISLSERTEVLHTTIFLASLDSILFSIYHHSTQKSYYIQTKQIVGSKSSGWLLSQLDIKKMNLAHLVSHFILWDIFSNLNVCLFISL